MTAVASINPARFLQDELAQASPDLMRHMLTTFINALLSAQADAVCRAGLERCGAEIPDQFWVAPLPSGRWPKRGHKLGIGRLGLGREVRTQPSAPTQPLMLLRRCGARKPRRVVRCWIFVSEGASAIHTSNTARRPTIPC